MVRLFSWLNLMPYPRSHSQKLLNLSRVSEGAVGPDEGVALEAVRHGPAPEGGAVAPLEVEALAVHHVHGAPAARVAALVRVPVVPVGRAPAGPRAAGPRAHVAVAVHPSLGTLSKVKNLLHQKYSVVQILNVF